MSLIGGEQTPIQSLELGYSTSCQLTVTQSPDLERKLGDTENDILFSEFVKICRQLQQFQLSFLGQFAQNLCTDTHNMHKLQTHTPTTISDTLPMFMGTWQNAAILGGTQCQGFKNYLPSLTLALSWRRESNGLECLCPTARTAMFNATASTSARISITSATYDCARGYCGNILLIYSIPQ